MAMSETEKKKDLFDKMVDLWWGKLVLAGILAGLTVFLYRDFAKLESGEVESMKVWAPIALLYNIAGMWGGLSIFIILSILLVFWGVKQKISGKE